MEAAGQSPGLVLGLFPIVTRGWAGSCQSGSGKPSENFQNWRCWRLADWLEGMFQPEMKFAMVKTVSYAQWAMEPYCIGLKLRALRTQRRMTFARLAVETGLIDALGDAVMLKALRQLQAWPDRRLSMAINVSVRQFLRPAFAAKVISRLVEFGIEPHRLCLEITESQMMENPRRALAILAELRAAGTEIAIDDFGTGFSSMAYVRDLPATLLKIDKLFVAGLPHSPRDVAVVTAILQLAHSLGMRTVAEGVETVEQLATLRELGSNFAQGYLLGRPLPPEKIIIPARVSIS